MMRNGFVEYYPTPVPGKTAVTLVAHGLNLTPRAMLPLVAWLNEQGSDVYLVKLSGHHKDGVHIKEVTSSVWQQEMLDGYNMAKKTSLGASVPLYFIGYSLGALLGQSMVARSMKTAPFDKQILIAPAIAIRRRSYLLKLLFFLGKKMSLPSYTPKGFRVNESLPLSIYEILFSEERSLVQSRFCQLNMPTLIIIDPKDELISYKKLVRHISRYDLTNYRLLVLDHQLNGRSKPYHHLVIDEQTMGIKNWKMVTSELQRFLFQTRKVSIPSEKSILV
jgi:esterase/lipase